jgi:hypothetical protein
MKCIQIFRDGKMDEITIKYNKNIISLLKSISIAQGFDELKHLYSWNYESDIIQCYGWYGGENSFINSHKLPQGGNSDLLDEESSLIKLYGDIFIIRFKDDNPIDLLISDYSVFYSNNFEDFSDCDSDSHSDILEENEEQLIEIIIEKKTKKDNQFEELEYDNYNY